MENSKKNQNKKVSLNNNKKNNNINKNSINSISSLDSKKDIQRENILENSSELFWNSLKLLYSFIVINIIHLSNFFLSQLKKRLEYILPDYGSMDSEVQQNKALINTINEIIESPEFQKRWNQTTDNIIALLKDFITKADREFGLELKKLMDQVVVMTQNTTKKMTTALTSGVYSGLCAIPIVDVICEVVDLGNVATRGITSSVTLFTSTLVFLEKINTSFQKVFGDDVLPFANTIKELIDLKNFIQNKYNEIQELPNNAISGLNNKVESLQSNLPSTQSGGKERIKLNKKNNTRKNRYSSKKKYIKSRKNRKSNM
jgi:hypothetical protein